jgi:acyl dehydratase
MGIAYEDLEVGSATEVGKHTFTPEEIIDFASQFDPQPFHLSEEGGRASLFGGLAASGWHTCSVMMGMLVRNTLAGSTSLGSPGIDEIRWLKPVLAGDTLTMYLKIHEKRVSSSRPNVGIVSIEWVGENQRGDTVISVRSKAMFGLRHPQS